MTKRRSNKEGSIWKDKNKWRAAVTLDGKRITRNFTSKAECKPWIREIQNQIAQGMTRSASNITLVVFLRQWLDVHKTQLAPKTALQYEQLVRDYINPKLGKIKLRELKLDKVEAHYQFLLSHGVTPRSVRLVHSILHKCFNDAIRRGYIGYNPAHGATLPRFDPKEMEILDEGEVLQFLIAVRGCRKEALYILAVKTGMRRGELLGLKWSDLDWQKGTIRVQRQAQRIRGQGIVFRAPKTKAGRRTIQLGEHTIQGLIAHKGRQQLEKEVAGEQWWENNLVFPSTVGTPLGGSNLLRDFKKQLKRSGVKEIRFHDLRHTAASLMLNYGVPVLVVSKILGHSKVSTTLDIYGHLISVMQEEAARIMDEIVTPIPVEMGEKLDIETSN